MQSASTVPNFQKREDFSLVGSKSPLNIKLDRWISLTLLLSSWSKQIIEHERAKKAQQ